MFARVLPWSVLEGFSFNLGQKEETALANFVIFLQITHDNGYRYYSIIKMKQFNIP